MNCSEISCAESQWSQEMFGKNIYDNNVKFKPPSKVMRIDSCGSNYFVHECSGLFLTLISKGAVLVEDRGRGMISGVLVIRRGGYVKKSGNVTNELSPMSGTGKMNNRNTEDTEFRTDTDVVKDTAKNVETVQIFELHWNNLRQFKWKSIGKISVG